MDYNLETLSKMLESTDKDIELAIGIINNIEVNPKEVKKFLTSKGWVSISGSVEQFFFKKIRNADYGFWYNIKTEKITTSIHKIG